MLKHAVFIRDARLGERDAIRDVTLAAYAEYATTMPSQMWAVYQRNILATLEGEGSVQPIVADRHDTIIGSVLFFPPASDAYGGVAEATSWPEVRLLAVAPAERGQGVGHSLMLECVRRGQQAGATALSLHTMDMMQSAMQLYTRMGFQRAPERDFCPAEGVVIKGFILPLA
jgi:GNAT superfamily N-acetyltransferase